MKARIYLTIIIAVAGYAALEALSWWGLTGLILSLIVSGLFFYLGQPTTSINSKPLR